jgi:hypothetical protein
MVFYFHHRLQRARMFTLVGTRCYFFKICLGGDGGGPAMVQVSILVIFAQKSNDRVDLIL